MVPAAPEAGAEAKCERRSGPGPNIGPMTVPSTMRAVVYRGASDMAVQQVPVPELGVDGVLVRVSRCGVCGSDVHLVTDGFARPGSILGHEWSGEIVAVGPSVDPAMVGWRVVSGGESACGTCRACRRGRSTVCRNLPPTDHLAFTGAYAEYFVTRAGRVLRIPDPVSDRAAALTEPLAVALHGITVAQVEAGDRVLVTGAGPIGLLTVAALSHLGVGSIVVSEPSPTRRERALAAGATRVVAPEELERPASGLQPVGDPYDIVIECSGNLKAVTGGLEQLDWGGTLVLVGTGNPDMPRLNHIRLMVMELTITAAFNHDHDGFERALELLATGSIPVDAVLGDRDVALSEVLEVVIETAAGRGDGKVLVDPWA